MNNCAILYNHYQEGICKSGDYTAQIIEVLPENTNTTVY